MIETLLMASSLAVLGYAFYISSRMYWSSRRGRGVWKWLYVAISLFILVTYVIFAFVLFSFVTNLAAPAAYVSDSINTILGILLLSGAGLIGAIMKYHLSVETGFPAAGQPPGSGHATKSGGRTRRVPPEVRRLESEIRKLRKELGEAKALNRLAVGREMRIIEMKKKIEEMEKAVS